MSRGTHAEAWMGNMIRLTVTAINTCIASEGISP